MNKKLLLNLLLVLGLTGAASAANNIFYTASADPNNNPDSVQSVDVWSVNANTGGSYFRTTPLAGGQTGQWTIWGNGNHNTTAATHVFAGGALTDGQTVSINYAHGGNIDAGFRVGIRLLDAGGNVQAEFSFQGGDANFSRFDTGSGVFSYDTGKDYDSFDLFNLSYTIGAGDTNYSATSGPGFNAWGGAGATWSGTVTSPIAQIQVFTAGGWNSDQMFNNLQVTTANVCPAIYLGLQPTPLLKNAASSNNVVGSGGVAPYAYTVIGGTLPANLSLSSAGALTGTPTNSGLSTFTVRATDANGCNGTNTFALRVYDTGVDHSGNYASWNGNGGTGFDAWSFHTDNHGSGFAGAERTSSGSGNIHVPDGSAWKLYAIDFNAAQQQEEAIAYRTFSSPLQVSNDLFSVSMEMQNGNAGLGAPGRMGFALRNGNGTGTGNELAAARLAVYYAGGSNNVVVFDAAGASDSGVPVGLGTACDFTARLTSGNTYELTITRYTNGAGATASPVVITGTLAGSGVINSLSLFNTKNSTESDNRNSDAYFNRLGYDSANFVCPTITLGNLGSGLAGAAYSFPISAAGGLAPYNFSVTSGTLPAGLTLSSGGVLSGTPSTAGQSTFTVTTTDGNNCTGSRAYTLTIHGTGADDAANYASWANGATGGSGFGPWIIYYNNHGNGFAGAELASSAPNIAAANGQVWKMYAINFTTNQHLIESTAYRRFNVPLATVGDTFSLSFANGNIGNAGQVGFALRNGMVDGANNSITNGANNRATFARLQVYFAGGGSSLVVEDASGVNPIPGVGFTSQGYDCSVTLTGPNTYSLTVVRYSGTAVADAPVTVTGTLAGTGPIDSFAIFTWKNSTQSGVNGDTFWGNLGYTSATPLITNNVTFQVDMTAQIFAGNFDPANDIVELRGGFSNWVAGLTLTNDLAAVNTNLYSGVFPVSGAAGSGISYKFVRTNLAGTVVFESSAPKLTTLDSGPNTYNRFLQLPNAPASVVPSVFFDDLMVNDYLPVDMNVTFSVDMNGAVTTSGSNFVVGTDQVWINGAFIPWYPWYDPISPVFGPAQYQMTDVGGGIYSVTVTIPKGKPVAFAYKYGVGLASLGDIGPRDNEAVVGQDHFRVIRTTATGAYTMPQDKFGTQYHEPFFNNAAKAAGQLNIGPATGGTLPVSWLGRPGARLQTAAVAAGPWTDQFSTDGTNWTSGVNTTNGLMSVTNWPTSGNTFFRLVKP